MKLHMQAFSTNLERKRNDSVKGKPKCTIDVRTRGDKTKKNSRMVSERYITIPPIGPCRKALGSCLQTARALSRWRVSGHSFCEIVRGRFSIWFKTILLEPILLSCSIEYAISSPPWDVVVLCGTSKYYDTIPHVNGLTMTPTIMLPVRRPRVLVRVVHIFDGLGSKHYLFHLISQRGRGIQNQL